VSKRRRFTVIFTGSIVIDLDQKVIDAVDDEWRAQMYGDVHTPEDIASHIGWNVAVNGCTLTQIDGFADQHNDSLHIVELANFEVDECVEAAVPKFNRHWPRGRHTKTNLILKEKCNGRDAS
jgi:hypothetical protein